jgi:hypothetical protein
MIFALLRVFADICLLAGLGYVLVETARLDKEVRRLSANEHGLDVIAKHTDALTAETVALDAVRAELDALTARISVTPPKETRTDA